MKPKETVKQWVDFFNRADSEKISELYHDDAVNHQVVSDPVIGKENIRKMFSDDFANAKMTCIPEHLFEDGEWAILEWKDPQGRRGCGFFHVVDGRIKFQRGYWDKLTFSK